MLRRLPAHRGAVMVAAAALVAASVRADPGVALVEVNGVPLAVTERALPADAEHAARVLHSRWRRETPAAWIGWQRVGPRHIVSRLRGALHETASIRPAVGGRGSRVVISVLDMSTSPRPMPPAPVDLPHGSRWLSSARPLDDAGETTSEWLAFTDRPPAAARSAWRASLHRSGWGERVRSGVPGELFEREGETILLHLLPVGRGTSVVLQLNRGSAP